MRDHAPPGPLSDDVLDTVETLYLDGLFLQAKALGERYRPLHAWRGTRGLLLAARLHSQLGGLSRAHALATLAWRQAPESAAARAAYGRGILARAGPFKAWEFVRRHETLHGGSPVGSRAGAVPDGPSPAPATSNGADGFPVRRSPAGFAARVM